MDNISYGILEGETIKEISGGLFGSRAETGVLRSLRDVPITVPV